MVYGLAYLVSLRFLSESLVIEAIYSITNSGVLLESWGLSYSENVYAGAHPRLSMGDPYPIDLWKHSRPVCERVPRHSVSWHLVPQSGPGSFSSFSSIHSLTKSRLQSGLVLVFSTSAFVIAIVTTVMTWDSSLPS